MPAPPAPPRRRRGLIVGLVGAVVLVVLIGAGAFVVLTGKVHFGPAKAKGPAALGDGRALLAEILPPPAGSMPLLSTLGPDETATLKEFDDTYFGDPDMVALLQEAGFEVAAETTYGLPDGGIVYTLLSQFATTNGAATFLQQQRAAFAANPQVIDKINIANLAGGASFEFSIPDSAHDRHAVLVARSGHVVVMMFVYTTSVIQRDVNEFLIIDQIRALPAGS